MAHLFVPQNAETELPVFFNVHGVVGAAPAQNNREDVLFVQFCFRVIADKPLATTTPEFQAAVKAVQTTGVIDPATINAIRLFQKNKNKSAIVDGRVSPAKGGYSYGAAIYTIANLNESIQHRNLELWPRIDKISGCPNEIVDMVRRTVIGK